MPVALVNGRVLADDGILQDRAVLLEGDRIFDVVFRGRYALQASGPPRPRRPPAAAGFSRYPGERRRRRALQCRADGRRHPRDRPGPPALRHDRLPADAHQRRSAMWWRARSKPCRRAIAAGVPGVLGIHIEGPYPQRRAQGRARFRETARARRRRDRPADLAARRQDPGDAGAGDDDARDHREADVGRRGRVGRPHQCHL